MVENSSARTSRLNLPQLLNARWELATWPRGFGREDELSNKSQKATKITRSKRSCFISFRMMIKLWSYWGRPAIYATCPSKPKKGSNEATKDKMPISPTDSSPPPLRNKSRPCRRNHAFWICSPTAVRRLITMVSFNLKALRGLIKSM